MTQVVYTLRPEGYGSLVSQFRSGAAQFFLFDGLGSTDRLTDISGLVTDSYLYKAFGLIQASSGSSVNPFRFVGQLGYYYNADSNRYLVRPRVYEPVLGRWLTKDPLGFATRDLNAYRYTFNNPLSFVDPSGLIGGRLSWQTRRDCPDIATEIIVNAITWLNGLLIRWGGWRIYSKNSIATITLREGVIAHSPEWANTCQSKDTREGPDLVIRGGDRGRDQGYGWVYEIKPVSYLDVPSKQRSTVDQLRGYWATLNSCGVPVAYGNCAQLGTFWGTSFITIEGCEILFWTCRQGVIYYEWVRPTATHQSPSRYLNRVWPLISGSTQSLW